MISSKVSLQAAQEAVRKHGSNRKAAKALGVDEKTIRRVLKSGLNEDDIVDVGHEVVRRSRLRKTDEGIEWVITQKSRGENPQTIRAVYEAIAAETLRSIPPAPKPSGSLKNSLLNVYTVTDFHLGMMALAREGGADWNMEIAENTLRRVYQQMLDQAPPAKTAVLAQLGDLLHFDSLLPLTPTSHHVLDASTRFSELTDIAANLLVWLVQAALRKHDHVHVICAEGNHDMASSQWLRVMLKVLFKNEPRVTIDISDVPYYAYEFGKTMLVWHHGHLSKPDQMPAIAAAQFREMWGRCPHVYGHLGDKHHLYVKEHAGMIVTQHPTLTARDSYTSRHAWFSQRAAYCHTYSKDFGEVGFVRVTPEMIGI